MHVLKEILDAGLDDTLWDLALHVKLHEKTHVAEELESLAELDLLWIEDIQHLLVEVFALLRYGLVR